MMYAQFSQLSDLGVLSTASDAAGPSTVSNVDIIDAALTQKIKQLERNNAELEKRIKGE